MREQADHVRTRPARWKQAAVDLGDPYQKKREAVIAEASRAFGRHGARNVSLDEIAHALNVTKPALYYYFRNKQELIYECHEMALRLGDETIGRAARVHATGFERIAFFFRDYSEHLSTDMGAPAILEDFTSLSPLDRDRIRQRRRQIDHRLRQIVDEGIADGSIRPCDSKLVVFWFMGAINLILRWYRSDGGYGPQQIAGAFIDLLASGIRSDAGAGAGRAASAALAPGAQRHRNGAGRA